MKYKLLLALVVIGLVIGTIELSTRNEIVPSDPSSVNVPSEKIKEISTGEITLLILETPQNKNATERIQAKKEKYPIAKELVSPDAYINTENIRVSDHIGKDIILIDFWTYSCINCQRTIPYLNNWHEKYKDKGLVIIGVHSPEFAFEKELANVMRAVAKFGIQYPVVLDNSMLTWQAYNNHYWPHKYLIDIDGFIAFDHIGEGRYRDVEIVIQQLLEEREEVLQMKDYTPQALVNDSIPNFILIKTPELYFGYNFFRNQLGNYKELQKEVMVEYKEIKEQVPNKYYLTGNWKAHADHMELLNDGTVTLQYSAKDVHIVAGSEPPQNVIITANGNVSTAMPIADQTLYTIVEGESYGDHTVKIAAKKGFTIYSFTFG